MKRRTLLGIATASIMSLSGCFAATEYTVSDVNVESSTPLSLSVEIVEPDAVIEHPARLEFVVTNQRENPVEIRNTGIWPLGLLELTASLDAQEAAGTILWTDRYAASQYVDAKTRQNYGTESTPLVKALDPDETVSEMYELHGDDIVQTGTAYVRGEFNPPILEYSLDQDEDWHSFLPEITVELATKSIL